MLRNAMIFIMFPTIALAHEGAHFHPHGIEPVWAVAGVAIALAVGFVLGRMRPRG